MHLYKPYKTFANIVWISFIGLVQFQKSVFGKFFLSPPVFEKFHCHTQINVHIVCMISLLGGSYIDVILKCSKLSLAKSFV